jgi:cellulose synthase/poly-beta-1,6-N-acetylglucosamine synthase-like glycosyltransferase
MAQLLDSVEARPESARLGEVLIRRGAVTEADLLQALERQRREGGRLGELLVMQGACSWPSLAAALGEQLGIGTLDLQQMPVDDALLSEAALESYRLFGWVPWRKEGDTLVIAALDLTPLLIGEIRLHVGHEVALAFLLTSPRDLQQTLARRFAQTLDHTARMELRQRYPVWSAWPRRGDAWILNGLLVLVALVVLSPLSMSLLIPVLMGSNLLFLLSLLFKWRMTREGRRAAWPQGTATRLPDEGLPIYTVLVPLYREASSVPGILDALAALDYPSHKLDVKLVVESDDTQMLDAIYAARPPAYVELLRVPVSQPRTKPKACNYALQFARGEYVTIYDAEDRPAPDQLRKAVALFLSSPPDVVCLQARLNYYNRDENWLTRLFALEYALLFERMIPALYHRDIPIPLGGTSNHLALKRLRKIGAWDPFNVTEDADLGLRLAAAGLKTCPLDSLTLEEAPLHISAWLGQRSRWIKGYLITWIVHMRTPGRIRSHCGLRGFLGLQLLIGGASLIYLITPLLWTVCLIWWAIPSWQKATPEGLLTFCLATLGLGMFAQWQMAWKIAGDLGWRHMRLTTLIFPFYWFLHSVASFKALWQLVFSPFYWEKTEHGLTQVQGRQIPPKKT